MDKQKNSFAKLTLLAMVINVVQWALFIIVGIAAYFAVGYFF